MTVDPKCADLVFEGGGVKGIGLAGAFAVLEERKIAPKRVAGTSAGAIVAALVAAGYRAGELAEIVRGLPYDQFKDERPIGHVPGGEVWELFRHRGLYRGDFFLSWMRDRLEEKRVRAFGDLPKDDDGLPVLRVIASDLTGRQLLQLPRDADKLGLEPDRLGIAEAVRMSMSIPFFFEPVVADGHTIVDGGVLSNFPVWLFDCEGGVPRWPTFGLLLVEPEPQRASLADRLPAAEPHQLSVLAEIRSLVQTMMEAHDRMYVAKADFARTIPIKTLGVRTTEFDITPQRADALYESGRRAAAEFLDRWNFDGYIQEFRQGREHSRRAEVREILGRAATDRPVLSE